MSTVEIARNDWTVFFDRFSRQHRGWLITMDVINADIGDQVEVQNLPFEGIDYQPGSKQDDEIEIMAGSPDGPRITRRIRKPLQVWLKESAERHDDVLEITTSTTAALVRFRSAIKAEEATGATANR